VFVIGQDEKAVAQKIAVGPTEGDVTEAGGVEPGALIAMDNFNRLTDGAKVTIRQPGEGGRGPGGAGHRKGGGESGAGNAHQRGTNNPVEGGQRRGTNGAAAKAVKGDG
jgi:hypothetical protein